jgi:hypothetical protein
MDCAAMQATGPRCKGHGFIIQKGGGMRYMMLIYSRETAERTREADERVYRGHGAVMEDATRKGILLGAEPLAPTSTATTVRLAGDGSALVTDGPFAETKEQLAGYYILECANLDEAIEWAARIPTGCKGAEGCIEIRPMPGLPVRPQASSAASSENGGNG